MSVIPIFINREIKSIQDSTSLEHLIHELSINITGIAIAVNQHIVTKSDWSKTLLSKNDEITIIQATQGG